MHTEYNDAHDDEEKDVKIKVKSDSWLPVAIQSADWEAFQVLRNKRI